MFEDDNRTSRRGITILQRYNKTIVARCDWGPWVLYTLEGKWHPRLRLGFHFPPRVYKTPWCTKRHSVQQFVYCHLELRLVKMLPIQHQYHGQRCVNTNLHLSGVGTCGASLPQGPCLIDPGKGDLQISKYIG